MRDIRGDLQERANLFEQQINAAQSQFEQLIELGRIRDTNERAHIEQAQLDEVAINRAGGQGR